jgi:hypothetical protein
VVLEVAFLEVVLFAGRLVLAGFFFVCKTGDELRSVIER